MCFTYTTPLHTHPTPVSQDFYTLNVCLSKAWGAAALCPHKLPGGPLSATFMEGRAASSRCLQRLLPPLWTLPIPLFEAAPLPTQETMSSSPLAPFPSPPFPPSLSLPLLQHKSLKPRLCVLSLSSPLRQSNLFLPLSLLPFNASFVIIVVVLPFFQRAYGFVWFPC